MNGSIFKQLCLSMVLALSALTLTWITLAYAGEPGDLDTGFGGTGVVTKSISSGSDSSFSVAIQPNDGKILVSGIADNSGNTDSFALLRFNKDGSLDTNLNNTGIVTTPISAYANNGFSVAVQPDDKIVVAGASGFSEAGPYFAVARYTITGALDTDFNDTGVVTTPINGEYDVGQSAAIQPDGKILLGGYYKVGPIPIQNIALVRYTITGSLDTDFNDTGILTTSIGGSLGYGRSIAIQPDDKIVIVGWDGGSGLLVARYTVSGNLDTDFNGTGVVTYPGVGAESVALQPDGKIVVAGSSNGDFALLRYRIDGTLDTDFNGTGIVTTSIQGDRDGGLSVVIQPDGKIIVSGTGGSEDSIGAPIGDFAVARYNADGSLDTTFNGTGIVTTSINNDTSQGWSVALQEDGNIVVAGFVCDFDAGTGCDFAIARYLGSFTTHIPIILKEQ